MYKLLFLFLINTCFAQNPLNVLITGDCAPISSVYNYNGLVNGKNNYTANLTVSGGNPVEISIAYDGVKWVLHNGDITDAGFLNTTVPSGIIPPFIGWQPAGCVNGTLVISEVLSNLQFAKKQFTITPNPASEYLKLDFKNDKNQVFEFEIFDLLGRAIIFGNSNSNEKLSIENLITGTYIIQIKDEFGNFYNQKFIKN
jgi:Secretion system C-terminal sorting domain